MKFLEALNTFMGRVSEVVQPGQFLQGRLASASNGLVTIQLVSSNYIPATQEVTAISDNITFIRILP